MGEPSLPISASSLVVNSERGHHGVEQTTYTHVAYLNEFYVL